MRSLNLRFEENFVRFSIVEFGLHIQRLHYLISKFKSAAWFLNC